MEKLLRGSQCPGWCEGHTPASAGRPDTPDNPVDGHWASRRPAILASTCRFAEEVPVEVRMRQYVGEPIKVVVHSTAADVAFNFTLEGAEALRDQLTDLLEASQGGATLEDRIRRLEADLADVSVMRRQVRAALADVTE